MPLAPDSVGLAVRVFRSFIGTLLPQYLTNGLSNLDETYTE